MNEDVDAVQQESAPPIIQGTSSSVESRVANISLHREPASENRAPCRYFLSKRGCAYGSDCKFLHVVNSKPTREAESKDEGVKERGKARKVARPPVCRYYVASSGCKYGDECRYRHPARVDTQRGRKEGGEDDTPDAAALSTDRQVQQEGGKQLEGGRTVRDGGRDECHKSPRTAEEATALLNLTSFPGLGSRESGHKAAMHSNVVPPAHPHNSHTTHSSHSKRPGPSELSLGSFMATPTRGGRPHPPVSRPQRNKGKTAAELRQVELEQLEMRFQGNHTLVEKGKERCVYSVTFAPTNPDWNFPYKTIDLQVTIPHDYPTQPLTVQLSDDQGLPPAYITHGNQAISHYLATAVGKPGELMFRPFLHWLDKTITSVFKEAAKQVVTAELFSGAPDRETTPTAVDHTSSGSEGDGDDEEEEDQTSDGEEDDQSDEGSDPEQELPPSLGATEKRGTEMRLSGLVMGEGVGVGRCAGVRVTLQCTRCRAQQDESVRAESPVSQLCSKCQHCFSFNYRPAIVHTASSALGYLDLQGCIPVDLVLMHCEITLSCLECGRDNTTSGLNYGEHKDLWCKRCHAKLSIYVEQCRFIQHQPGAQMNLASAPPPKKSKKKSKKEALIQVGKPLPEMGTCQHYKKSNRWLRFPCCGKLYPCDACHDEAEDHVMERANRMVCGFCSREQSYASSRPCVGCGGDMVGGRAGAFWEGGMGCRNKTKMSKNDVHKYSSSQQKTQCKKQERVGQQVSATRSTSSH